MCVPYVSEIVDIGHLNIPNPTSVGVEFTLPDSASI